MRRARQSRRARGGRRRTSAASREGCREGSRRARRPRRPRATGTSSATSARRRRCRRRSWRVVKRRSQERESREESEEGDPSPARRGGHASDGVEGVARTHRQWCLRFSRSNRCEQSGSAHCSASSSRWEGGRPNGGQSPRASETQSPRVGRERARECAPSTGCVRACGRARMTRRAEAWGTRWATRGSRATTTCARSRRRTETEAARGARRTRAWKSLRAQQWGGQAVLAVCCKGGVQRTIAAQGSRAV